MDCQYQCAAINLIIVTLAVTLISTCQSAVSPTGTFKMLTKHKVQPAHFDTWFIFILYLYLKHIRAYNVMITKTAMLHFLNFNCPKVVIESKLNYFCPKHVIINANI